jgi:hypothetical protein
MDPHQEDMQVFVFMEMVSINVTNYVSTMETEEINVTNYIATMETEEINVTNCTEIYKDIENEKIIDLDNTTNKMADEKIKINSDVFTTSELKYLVRVDGKVFAFTDNEEDAVAIIASYATSEIKKLENPGVKVFSRELKDGKEVQIHTQNLGYVINGGLVKAHIIDMISVPRAVIVKKD